MPEDFSERLRKAREEKGLSQTDLADKTGLQPSAISHFETGKRAPSFDNLKRLADALAVSVDYLLVRPSQPGAVGPAVDQLFKNFNKMSGADQDAFVRMSEMLAAKNELNRRRKG